MDKKKTVTLGARIPAELHQRLNQVATESDKSQQQIVQEALEYYLFATTRRRRSRMEQHLEAEALHQPRN